jgi:hypothetical protein
MPKLATWADRSSFEYAGSVKAGTTIKYGRGFTIKVSASDYSRLLNFFSGSTVEIGTSRTNPPTDGLGRWLQANVTKTAIASYVGPILINNGYAVKVGQSQIRIRLGPEFTF